MNDKELADKVVALGVDFCTADLGAKLPERFVRDWRVAGALLEVCQAKRIQFFIDVLAANPDECMPRAIIEACVAALNDN